MALLDQTPGIGSPPPSIPGLFENTPPPVKKKNRTWLVVVIALMVIGSICMVAFFLIIFQQRKPLEASLDTFMVHMSAKNYESAYDMLSPTAKEENSLADMQHITEGESFYLYSGYRKIYVTSFNIQSPMNTVEGGMQLPTAWASGVITYEGNIKGTFTSILEKVGDQWLLAGLYIEVPPEKRAP